MILKEKTYDILALIQRMLMPVGTFIVAICEVLGHGESAKITAIISALSVLLATFLKECSKKYFDTGTITFLAHEEGEADDDH